MTNSWIDRSDLLDVDVNKMNADVSTEHEDKRELRWKIVGTLSDAIMFRIKPLQSERTSDVDKRNEE